MTQPEFPVDEISQAQDQLDQGLDPNQQLPQYVTVDQFQALQQALVTSNQSLRSVQGLLGKGLTSIRDDLTAQVRNSFEDLRSQTQQQAYLDSLDEDDRIKLGPLVEELGQLRQAVQQPTEPLPQQPQPQPQANPQQTEQAAWEYVYGFVESMGLPRNDPNVNYAVWRDQTLTPQQKYQTFYQSVRQAIVASAGATQPLPTNAPPPNTPVTRSPPVQDGASRRPTQARSGEDLLDQVLTQQITGEEYVRMLPIEFPGWGAATPA